MLLIYERLDLYALWLINIQYYLDLVWFNENGEWYMQEKTRSSEKPIWRVAMYKGIILY